MADIYTTLKTRTNQDNVYHNIDTANIPTGAVETAKIADGAVTSVKIADGAVTSVKIADGAVTSAKIANGAVDSAQIAIEAISHEKLEFNSVNDDNIVDGSITNAKIADGAVTSIKFNVYERSLRDIWNTYCGGNDFHNFCLAMETIMTSPFVKIYYQDTPSTYKQTVPVYIEVSRDDMITFHIKDYGVNTWTIVTFENGDPFPTTGLENVFVTEIGGVFDYLL